MCEAICIECEDCEQYQNGCGGQSGTFYFEACPASDQYIGNGRYQ